MEIAFSIGINVSEFEEMTPYELRVALRGFNKHKEREAEEYQVKLKNLKDLMIYNAYLTSRWVWAKNVDIEKILANDGQKKNKAMTNEQMFAQAKALTIMFGGEIRYKGGEKDGEQAQ